MHPSRRTLLLRISSGFLVFCTPSPMPAAAVDYRLPDAASLSYGAQRYHTLLVTRGQSVDFGISPALPAKDGAAPGTWHALFGAITPDGAHYTAPSHLPPASLDAVTFVPAREDLPKFQIWFSVLDAAAPPEWATGKHINRLKLEKIDSKGASKGYIVPAFPEDHTHYRLFLPESSNFHPMVCDRTSPLNPAPPPPAADAPKHIEVPSEPAVIEIEQFDNHQSIAESANPQVVVSPADHEKILKDYGIDIPAGPQPGIYKVHQTVVARMRWIDVYDRSGDGKSWVLLQTKSTYDFGLRQAFEPNWMSVIREAPSHGDTAWGKASAAMGNLFPERPR